MKKIILSFVFIFGFIAYAAYQFSGSGTAAPISSIVDSTQSGVSQTVGVQPKKTSPVLPVKNPQPAIPSQPVAVIPKPKGMYVDGEYTGDPTDAYYGTLQVKAVVSGGKLTDVVFLQYPNDRSRSASISARAMPILKSEAIQVQSSNVNNVSGATEISGAFIQSLSSALSQALN